MELRKSPNFVERILKLKKDRCKILLDFRDGKLTLEEKDIIVEKIDSDIKFLKTRLKNKSGFL